MSHGAWDVVRLSLHVVAATIWVGGQLVLAGLVPVLRRVSPDAPRVAARRFGWIAWPAYGVLLVTGVWNIAADSARLAGLRGVLDAKIGVVLLSGVAAFLHARSKTAAGLAVWGALSGLTALSAVVLGVVLSG